MRSDGITKRANNSHEKLSALMDGELTHDQQRNLLTLLKTDKELQATWQRYHLISNILQRKRKEAPIFNIGLSASVQAALAMDMSTWGGEFDTHVVMNFTHNIKPLSFSNNGTT